MILRQQELVQQNLEQELELQPIIQTLQMRKSMKHGIVLIGVSGNNHEVLLEVKEKYRTFLLSNNNEIHYDWIINYIKKEFGIENYDQHFEKAYFSQHMCLRKPNVNIFEQVIKENNLNPNETLFIDDSPQLIEGAKKAGLHTLLMNVHPKDLAIFLRNHKIL